MNKPDQRSRATTVDKRRADAGEDCLRAKPPSLSDKIHLKNPFAANPLAKWVSPFATNTKAPTLAIKPPKNLMRVAAGSSVHGSASRISAQVTKMTQGMSATNKTDWMILRAASGTVQTSIPLEVVSAENASTLLVAPPRLNHGEVSSGPPNPLQGALAKKQRGAGLFEAKPLKSRGDGGNPLLAAKPKR